jgi:exosortase/archaeosortase family protein
MRPELSIQGENSLQAKPGLMETHQALIALTALVLMALPFITTFNEFLTALVLRSYAYVAIQNFIVPIEGKMVGAILQYLFGVNTAISGSFLIIMRAQPLKVYISWNCIGWQSMVLFAITLLTGLRGPYTLASKILCVVAGIEGTILLNLLRIASVVLVAVFGGYMPAVLFHDYGGTILVVFWLILFWHFAFNHILKRQ